MPDPRLALALALALCALTLGCEPQPSASASALSAPPIAVRALPVKVRPMAARYLTSARLRANRRAAVTARTRGVIQRFLVEEGEQVAADAVIVELESADQELELAGAQAELASREATWRRNQTLFQRGALTEDTLRESELGYQAAKQRHDRAALDLARTRIRAPFAGQVLIRHADPGARVDDGTPLLDLADVYPLEADVSVPERHVSSLQVGQPAFLRGEGQPFMAEIARIAPAVDPTTGTVKVTLRVGHGVRERPGAFVQVAIVTALRPRARVVPRGALVGEGAGWHLFLLEVESAPQGAELGRGRARRVPVELGYEDGPWVEVQGALPAEAWVVVQGATALADESAVVWGEGAPPLGDELVAELLERAVGSLAPVASAGR